MKVLLTIAGVLCLLAGLLFAGQGMGYIPWPRTSFMIGQTVWVYYGIVIAAVGVVAIGLSRR